MQRTDDSAVPQWYRSSPATPDRVPQPQRYPHAGATNATVQLWRFDLEGEGTRVPLPEHEYLATVGGGLIGVFDRAQTRLALCDFSGDPVTTLEQRPWLDLVPGLPRRADGRLLAWRDEQQRRLTVDGAAVTPEDVQVRSLVGTIDGTIFLTACQSPAESRLARVDEAGFRWLSEPDRYLTATCEAGLIVTSETTWDSPRATVCIRDHDHRVLAEVPNLAEEPVVTPRPTLVSGGRDEVQTVVLWPSAATQGRLPVLMNPYGGPHAQRVLAARSAYNSAQWLADQGFCVVIADGRGTPGQSPAWEHAVAATCGTPHWRIK